MVLLLVREGSQLIISWRNYLGSAENRMEITMQVLTLCVLFLPLDPDSIRGLSVVLVLLVWTEALLFMSGIPRYYAVILHLRKKCKQMTNYLDMASTDASSCLHQFAKIFFTSC